MCEFVSATPIRVHCSYCSDLFIAKNSIIHLQDPSSPLLRSDEAFHLYLTSLLKTGLESSVNFAVRRRDSLLASAAATSSESVSQTAGEATPSASELGSSPSSSGVSESNLTSSQKIAQAVLSGKLAESTGTTSSLNFPGGGVSSVDIAKLIAALNSGAGVSGNPLQVAISECG
jgi:ATP-dependent metalloprotease